MPLIWNNKEYWLVNDDSEWNELDYVIARKLRVVYNEIITLDLVKKSFAVYGEIEKVETFIDNSSKTQIAHVTFKDSRTAYLVLMDCELNSHHNIEHMKPAAVHLQPDNRIGLAMSPFHSLPDKCRFVIFRHCDVTTLATLSAVCKKFYQLLRHQVFSNKLKFETVTCGNINVVDALRTVTRLVQCIDSKTFHIKIYRSFVCSEMPLVAVEFDCSVENKHSVDVSFYRTVWLHTLDPIVQLVKCVFIQRTIYDINLPYNGSENWLWPNATLLIMKGFSTKKSVPDFSSIVAAMPNLETILIKSLLFKMDLKSLYSKNLKKIYFENCSFKSDTSKDQFFQMANHVKAQGTVFPLCLIFDRIQYLKQQHVSYPIQFDGLDDKSVDDDDSENNVDFTHQYKEPEYISIVQESTYSEIMAALHNTSISQYLYIEIGKLYPA